MRLRWPPAQLVAGGWVAVVTVASIALRLRSPAWLLDLPHDDSLFARLAESIADGQWLGPYDQLTLAKGPGYPLFVAGVYELHLPLKPTEHVLHLVAAAVTGLAVGRVLRSWTVAIVAYTVLALDPGYLGASAARVVREGYYGSLCLLLFGGWLLLLTFVPSLVARGPRWSVPVVAISGPVLGLVAAGYYVSRDERSWLAPALLVASVAGVAYWRQRGSICRGHAVVVLGTVSLAAATLFGLLHWTTERNERLYGTSVISDLVDGEIAEAYAEWQRVDAGPERRYVPVSRQQREAVYEVSPAAAELEDALEGSVTVWFEHGCRSVRVCDDYIGAYFVWALRDAATASGHSGSGREAQRFFGQIADDISEACGDELRCSAPGVGPMPPLSRLDVGDLVGSYRATAETMLSYDVGEPERPWPSGGRPGTWETISGPLRGIGTEEGHIAYEARRMRDQEAVSLLTDLYRWGVRLGAVVAIVGLVLGCATRAGRRHPAALLLCAASLVAVLTRVALVALVDATSWPAADAINYLLPGVDFLLVFVVTGCSLVAAALDRTTEERIDPTPSGPVEAGGDERAHGEEPTSASVLAGRAVSQEMPTPAAD
jgi:hypothetical protein